MPGAHCVAQFNLELIILLPLPPKFWPDRHAATMPGSCTLINNVFPVFGLIYSIINIKKKPTSFPQIIKMGLICQLCIFPKEYSNKRFVYWNRKCWSTSQTKPPHYHWSGHWPQTWCLYSTLPHPLNTRNLSTFCPSDPFHGNESPSSRGLPVFKTTHLTTVWFLCQATWLAFKSIFPRESLHLRFPRLDRHLSVAPAHWTRISTEYPFPHSNCSPHLQPHSAFHPALCLRPRSVLIVYLFVWLFWRQALII